MATLDKVITLKICLCCDGEILEVHFNLYRCRLLMNFYVGYVHAWHRVEYRAKHAIYVHGILC